MLLYGMMDGNIDGRKGVPTLWKRYSVPAGTPHSAVALTDCVFINFERWKDKDVTSAAIDFTAV